MLIGHQKQIARLQEMQRQQKMPHALLFCGPECLGKKTVAIEFLKETFGQDLFHHPDFIFLESAEREIKISQIRNLNWKLSLKPFSAPYKGVIINEAHLMNQEAQNCLLKTLEEPRGDTLLILITEYPDRLLPTIRSRVQKFKFFPVDKKAIENYLKSEKLQEKERSVILELSQGRPGVAVNFISDPKKLVDFKRGIREISSLLDSNLGKRLEYAKNLSQEEDVIQALNVWQNLFRNILLSRLGLCKKWVVPKKEYSLEKIKIILKNIQTTMFLISTTNANKRLALELFLIEL